MTSQRTSKSSLLTAALVAIVVIVAGWWSYGVRGDIGLLGSAVGSAVTLAICFVAHVFFRASAKAEGAASIRAAQLGIIVGFMAVSASVITVTQVWKEGAPSFALTSVAVYTVFRISDALAAQRNVSIVSMMVNASTARDAQTVSPASSAGVEPTAGSKSSAGVES